MVKFSEGARARHVCASNGAGFCNGCLVFESLAVLVARAGRRASVIGPKRTEFARDLVRLAYAGRKATARTVKAAAEAVEAVEAAAEAIAKREAQAATVAERKAQIAEREAQRAAGGAARRVAKREKIAKAANARRNAAQAATIAKRVSMDATYRVFVKFTRGAHEVEVARMGEQRKGFQESRAGRKTRGDAVGLRFFEAEMVAANVDRKLSETGNSRTFRVDRQRRG